MPRNEETKCVLFVIYPFFAVAPYMGAWIEIGNMKVRMKYLMTSLPIWGAWIEIIADACICSCY